MLMKFKVTAGEYAPSIFVSMVFPFSVSLSSSETETVSFNQCCKYCYFAEVPSYTRHLLHFCPSREWDPSHVAL